MADSIQTLRASSMVINDGGAWVPVGTGSLVTAVNDNSDGTYARLPGFPGSGLKSLVFLMNPVGGWTPPALAQIRSITQRARHYTGSFVQGQLFLSIAGLYQQSDNLPSSMGGIGTFTGTPRTTRGDGSSWDSVGTFGLQLHMVYNGSFLDQDVNWYEAYVDIAYNQAPVVIVGGPARAVTDGATTNTSTTVTSATAFFQPTDVGKSITGSGIPAGATIASVTNTTTVVISAAATATASSVALTIGALVANTNKPTISWGYTDPEGDTQERFVVKIFDAATVGGGGFNPESSTPAQTSGETFSSSALWTATTSMTPAVTYYPYVKVADAGSGGRYSNWAAGTPFSIVPTAGLLFDPPATPTVVSATPDSVLNRVAVVVQGGDNELTRNQSSIESSAAGWEVDANTAIVRDTTATVIPHGLAALKLTSVASGNMSARTFAAATGTASAGYQYHLVPVSPSKQYTALASFRASTAGRSVNVAIRWYSAAGALLSTSTGSNVTDTTSAWTQASVTATSPGTAAYAGVVLNVLATAAASEVHWADKMSLAPGASTTWFRGGFVQMVGRVIDTFTRADSAVTLGNSEGAGTPAWTALTATWGIASNRAYVASGGTTNSVAVLTSPAAQDGELTVDITLSPTANRGYAGVVLRAADATNNLHVMLAKIGTGSNDVVYLSKNVAGAVTQLAQLSSAGLINGATYGLKVQIYGGLVRVYLDRKAGLGFQLAFEWQLQAADVATFGTTSNHRVGMLLNITAGNDDGLTRIDNFTWQNAETQTVQVDRSVDGGVTWSTVRTINRVALVDPGQLATLIDYEAPRQTAVTYRARTLAAESDQSFMSANSSSLLMSPNLVSDGLSWLKSPTDPTKNVVVKLLKDTANSTSTEDIAVFEALGRADPLIHGGTVRTEVFEGLEFWCDNDAAYAALEVLRRRQEPLLLQTCYGDAGVAPEEFWVRLGPSRAVSRITMPTSTTQLRRVKIPARQVLAPVVV